MSIVFVLKENYFVRCNCLISRYTRVHFFLELLIFISFQSYLNFNFLCKFYTKTVVIRS